MLRLMLGAVAGYVLGARAGRERYEQIKRLSTKVADNPAVHSAVESVSEQVKGLVDKGKAAISRS